MKKRIYYFHGFKSAGGGSKVETLKKVYGGEYEILSPTLPSNIYDAKSKLHLIAKELETEEIKEIIIIGTSLGGFYTYYFAKEFYWELWELDVSCSIILINPVLKPSEHLKKYIGKNVNFKTGEKFEFTDGDLLELKLMEDKIKKSDDFKVPKIIILGEHDDLVDVNKVAEYFHEDVVKFYDDDHRFNNKFEEMLNEKGIRSFIKSSLFFKSHS
jgi:predicted esterase YcpF (UPF0227 family)